MQNQEAFPTMNHKAEYVDRSMGICALLVDRMKGRSATAAEFDDSEEARVSENEAAIMTARSCGSTATAVACLSARHSREHRSVPQQPVDDDNDLKCHHVQATENVHARNFHIGNYVCSVPKLGARSDRPFGRASIGIDADGQAPDMNHLVSSVQTAEAVAVDVASQQGALDAKERLLEECVDGRDDDSTAAAPVPHGTTFLSKLGKGHFGFVSLVKRKVDGMLLASKQVHRDLFDRAEYNLLALCHHENIVRVVDLVGIGDWMYLLLEYQQGPSLNIWKAETTGNCPMTEDKLDLLGLDMLNALYHLEQRRIVHRDIKPSNIVVTLRPDGLPKFVLIDFGLSERLPPGRSTVCIVKFRGTPVYSAPECVVQCRALEYCNEGVGPPADIWSLGVVITEMCCTCLPWLQPARWHDDIAGYVRACAWHIQGMVRNEKLVRCSALWRDLLVRMIAYEADKRPRPEDLLRTLNEIRRRTTPDFALLLQSS